ncbi:hypothetical protein Tco_0383041 [Tanacetum coccineum]
MAFLFLGPNRLASPRVNGYLVKASSNPFTFYDFSSPQSEHTWIDVESSINLAAAIFVAVSILKALKTEDLSRKLEVNYVKFQFRGDFSLCVFISSYWEGKPLIDDKGFVDSGCSRHVTGNIAYLSDFKEFDGGYVTFGGGAHGGSGPRCQDNILGGVDAQTRFETTSNSLLDPPSLKWFHIEVGEDNMKPLELMTNCTKLCEMVLDLEMAKDAQAKEIVGLKKRGKRVRERKKIISKIDDVVNDLKIRNVTPKAVTTAAATTTTTRPKARGVVVQEPSEFRTTTSSPQPSKTKDKGKAIMIEPEVPLKKKYQVALDEEMTRNLEAQLQAELIEEERLARKKEEEANIALIESWENTQAVMEADRLLAGTLNKRARGVDR